MAAATLIPLPTALDGMNLPDLESELLGLAGHLAAAEARFLRLLAEFDQRGGWVGVGIRSCAHWLSCATQTSWMRRASRSNGSSRARWRASDTA
jgi:hypothetical protein